jgi:hypothetical protein
MALRIKMRKGSANDRFPDSCKSAHSNANKSDNGRNSDGTSIAMQYRKIVHVPFSVRTSFGSAVEFKSRHLGVRGPQTTKDFIYLSQRFPKVEMAKKNLLPVLELSPEQTLPIKPNHASVLHSHRSSRPRRLDARRQS